MPPYKAFSRLISQQLYGHWRGVLFGHATFVRNILSTISYGPSANSQKLAKDRKRIPCGLRWPDGAVDHGLLAAMLTASTPIGRYHTATEAVDAAVATRGHTLFSEWHKMEARSGSHRDLLPQSMGGKPPILSAFGYGLALANLKRFFHRLPGKVALLFIQQWTPLAAVAVRILQCIDFVVNCFVLTSPP